MAARWVAANLAARPGFRGALLHGSVCYLDAGARLPAESDIDVVSLWDAPPPAIGKTRFEDAVLDVCGVPAAGFADPERVLADHIFAGSFASRFVVADPDGAILRVASSVAERFRDPR